jgi:hypothetical protein
MIEKETFDRTFALACGDDASSVCEVQRQDWSGHVKLLRRHP